MNRQIVRSSWVQQDLVDETQIDCIETLGRPAKGCRWIDTSGTGGGTITLHFNSLSRVVQKNETEADTIVQQWRDLSTAAARLDYPNISLTNGQQVGSGTGRYEGLEIHSIHVTALSAGCSGNCELVIW